jgi:enoyl-CoA hydratase/carnithine racemase
LRDRLSDTHLRELLLLAEPIDARRALEICLVRRVAAGENLLAEARELAATILKGAPDAVRQTKRLLRDARSASGPALFQLALQFHTKARGSAEAAEGLAAFRERREPNWSK